MAKTEESPRKGARAKALTPSPSLERSPSHLLHGALQLALDIYAEELGAGAITQRQFAVLAAAAEREGLTQTELVRATGIDRSTLADMITRMIAKDLLTRQRSTADARANAVTLTDSGRAALAEAAPKVAAADARILAALSEGKREGFVNQLRKLARAGEPEPTADAEAPRKKPKTDRKALKSDKKQKKKERRAAKADDAAAPGAAESSDLDVEQGAGTE